MAQPTTPAHDTSNQYSRFARLARGQSLRIWLPSDSMIVAHAGELTLTEPLHWLDGQPFGNLVPLADGQAHQLPRAGWVEIHTTHGTEFLCLWNTPSAWYRRTWMSFMDVVRPGRRTLQGRIG